MVAINTNPGQNDQIPEWRTKGKYTFPVVLSDPADFARTNYSVSGTPTNMLLNADGKMVFRHIGYSSGTEKVMEAEIREMLGLNPFEEEKTAPSEQEHAKKDGSK